MCSSIVMVILFGCQVEEVKKMKIGDPLDRSTDHGPQNHKAHLDKLVEYCQTGIKEGATLVCGGKQVQRPGKAALSPLSLMMKFGSVWSSSAD